MLNVGPNMTSSCYQTQPDTVSFIFGLFHRYWRLVHQSNTNTDYNCRFDSHWDTPQHMFGTVKYRKSKSPRTLHLKITKPDPTKLKAYRSILARAQCESVEPGSIKNLLLLTKSP